MSGAGVELDRLRYDDFGNVDGVVSSGGPFRFQGLWLDDETGLLYARNRYLDPGVGRFLQRDPVWGSGNVGGFYTFAGNSPVSMQDPLGLQQGSGTMVQVEVRPGNKTWVLQRPDGSLAWPSPAQQDAQVSSAKRSAKSTAWGAGVANYVAEKVGVARDYYAKKARDGKWILGGLGATAADLSMSGDMFRLGEGASRAAQAYEDGAAFDSFEVLGELARDAGRAAELALTCVPGGVGARGAGRKFGPNGLRASAEAADLLRQTGIQSQLRKSALHQLVDGGKTLIVSEHHLRDLKRVLQKHNGKWNALNSKYWKHVLPHRHIYRLPQVPTKLNANWRKTFEKNNAQKTTVVQWY